MEFLLYFYLDIYYLIITNNLIIFNLVKNN